MKWPVPRPIPLGRRTGDGARPHVSHLARGAGFEGTVVFTTGEKIVKVLRCAADTPLMINSISSTHTTKVDHSSQTRAKPAASAQKPQKTSTPQDTVTIKSGGDADHDGDSK